MQTINVSVTYFRNSAVGYSGPILQLECLGQWGLMGIENLVAEILEHHRGSRVRFFFNVAGSGGLVDGFLERTLRSHTQALLLAGCIVQYIKVKNFTEVVQLAAGA
jgi:hypothetical protein